MPDFQAKSQPLGKANLAWIVLAFQYNQRPQKLSRYGGSTHVQYNFKFQKYLQEFVHNLCSISKLT